MIAGRIFTKKVNGKPQRVLEGKEIPKGFFTDKEMADLEKKNAIFKDEKTRQDFKKTKQTETEKAVKESADKMKKLADGKKPKKEDQEPAKKTGKGEK